MQFRALTGLLVLVCAPQEVVATSCATLPPCASVRPGSVLFVGTVQDTGELRGTGLGASRDVRVSVQEIFVGLPPGTKEVVATAQGSWLEKGAQYLFDTDRGEDGHLYLRTCGQTADIQYEGISGVLEFLRRRAQGKTVTSLTVRAIDQNRPIPGATVTITGPGGKLTKTTGDDGSATFSDLPAGSYGAVGQNTHYRTDPESVNEGDVEVVAGGCANAWVSLQPESRVAGLVRDISGAPARSLTLELVSAPLHPGDKVSISRPYYLGKADSEGRFAFEGVSPGTYLLGSNIMGLGSSTLPPVFYPGQRGRNGAVPVEVGLGEPARNLVFALPDFGSRREIEVCVVDQAGSSVPAAAIGTALGAGAGDDIAMLGQNLRTDESGCVRTAGYTGAAYAVNAILRPSADDFTQTRISKPLVIPPGEDPVHKVLVLGPPLGSHIRKPN